MENNEIQIEPRERIKLSKMSKGYQWEISLLNIKGEELNFADIKRLDELNALMHEKYGGKE